PLSKMSPQCMPAASACNDSPVQMRGITHFCDTPKRSQPPPGLRCSRSNHSLQTAAEHTAIGTGSYIFMSTLCAPHGDFKYFLSLDHHCMRIGCSLFDIRSLQSPATHR